MRPILLVLVLAGCFASDPEAEVAVGLDSFSMLHVTATEHSVEIVLGDRDPFTLYAPCPLVDPNLTARLGGVPVPLITRGGKIGDEAGDDVSDNRCGTVKLALDGPPPDGTAALELSDPDTGFTCNLPDLKAAREMALVPPESGTWQWRSGQAVAVQWSPSGDLQLPRQFLATLHHLTGEVIDNRVAVPGTAVDGDLVRFTVPSVPPGSYVVDLSPSWIAPCGPRPISLDISSTLTRFAADHRVAIVP
jgi:hypothetical protein